MTKSILALTLLSILLIPDRNLHAQATNQDLERRVAALENLVNELGQDTIRLRTDIESNRSAIAQNDGNLAQLGRSVESNGSAVIDLLQRVQANDDTIKELTEQLRDANEKLSQVVSRNGQGAYYLNYNMQVPEARRGFTNAVRASGTSQVKLWFRNPGPFDRIVHINGTRWRAIRGWSYVWVPFGNVAVSEIANVTPPARTVRDEDWNAAAGEYQMVYDFSDPWR